MLQPFLKRSYYRAITDLPKLRATRYDMLHTMWRSMATQRPNQGNKKVPQPAYNPITRPSDVYDTTGRVRIGSSEEHKRRLRAKQWAEVVRAKARIDMGHTPQQLRAFKRLRAEWEALIARDIAFSADRRRQLLEVGTPGMIRWMEEQLLLMEAWFHAALRSTGLCVFAPMGDVGVDHRIRSLTVFIAYVFIYWYGRILFITRLWRLRLRFKLF